MQESKQNEGLPLLSNQFSKQRGSMGCLLRARSVLQGHGVLALRHTPSTRAVQAESQLQEEAGKWKLAVQEGMQNESLKLVGSSGKKATSRFEATFSSIQKATFGSMACLLRARFVLQGHGVLALRHGPST